MNGLYKSYPSGMFKWFNSSGAIFMLEVIGDIYYLRGSEVLIHIEKSRATRIYKMLDSKYTTQVSKRYENLATLIRSGQLNQS